jgi:hypothetical protein
MFVPVHEDKCYRNLFHSLRVCLETVCSAIYRNNYGTAKCKIHVGCLLGAIPLFLPGGYYFQSRNLFPYNHNKTTDILTGNRVWVLTQHEDIGFWAPAVKLHAFLTLSLMKASNQLLIPVVLSPITESESVSAVYSAVIVTSTGSFVSEGNLMRRFSWNVENTERVRNE